MLSAGLAQSRGRPLDAALTTGFYTGPMFAAEFEPAEIDEQRHMPRAPVSLDAEIGKAGRSLCRVVDVSIHGARLQTYVELTKGSVIWLTLPGADPIAADVMWADDFAAGCRFHRPLPMELFDQLVALNR